jgi:hypothetical protein
MRRDVWDTIGGWVQLPGYWAGEEQMNTLLAHRMGIPIKLLKNHECQHRRYRKRAVYPFELPKHHPGEIAHYIHGTCLPSTYEDVWKPLITHYYDQNPVTDQTIMRGWVEDRAVYSEERVLRTLFGTSDMKNHPAVKAGLQKLEKVA